MASAGAPAKTTTLSLFQDLRDRISSRRISDPEAVQSEIEATLNHERPSEDSSRPMNDLCRLLIRKVQSLQEKVAECERKLADLRHQSYSPKGDTITTIETLRISTHTQYAPPNIVSDPAPSRVAAVSFPGGPRSITVYQAPSHPNYHHIIRDERGEVTINVRRTKPLRREGAFRGAIEEIDWQKITHVYGRGHNQSGAQTASHNPRWSERSKPPLSRYHQNHIISRQCKLATTLHTDACERVHPAKRLFLSARAPSLPTGMSSFASITDSLPCSSECREVSPPPSEPPSPSVERGRKRSHSCEDKESTPVAEARSADQIKCEDEDEGPDAKRQRLQSRLFRAS